MFFGMLPSVAESHVMSFAGNSKKIQTAYVVASTDGRDDDIV
jgi:hypothetical protein